MDIGVIFPNETLKDRFSACSPHLCAPDNVLQTLDWIKGGSLGYLYQCDASEHGQDIQNMCTDLKLCYRMTKHEKLPTRSGQRIGKSGDEHPVICFNDMIAAEFLTFPVPKVAIRVPIRVHAEKAHHPSERRECHSGRGGPKQ